MNQHGKKMIGPIIIVLILIGYYIAAVMVVFRLHLSNCIKLSVGIVSIAVTVMLIAVLLERIKEIRKGEEDDLGKY